MLETHSYCLSISLQLLVLLSIADSPRVIILSSLNIRLVRSGILFNIIVPVLWKLRLLRASIILGGPRPASPAFCRYLRREGRFVKLQIGRESFSK